MTLSKLALFHNPGLARLLKFTGLDAIEASAHGTTIVDESGRFYLDFAGGYGVFNVGHTHPKVIAAVQAQLHKMPLASKLLVNRPLVNLAEKLADILPGDLECSFFCNSGAEAVEGAIKLARMATGRTQIVSTINAFHGKTMGALSATGRDAFKTPFLPLVEDFCHVPFGDVEAIGNRISDATAAVILEPIQGEGGIVLPPKGYMLSVRELCRTHGALLIADEIQTGMGRTGHMFAVQHDEIVPDIMTLAKGLSGGVIPIGAFSGTRAVWNTFASDPLIITSTFGGNPLACVSALAAIEVIEEENLVQAARTRGQQLIEGLRRIQWKYPRIIADVRGRGLMIGVELAREGLGGMIIPDMVRGGVLAAYTLNQPRVIRFEPPLVVTEAEVAKALEVFEQVCGAADSKFTSLFPETVELEAGA